MDHYLEQTFKINLLKIGYFTNAGVLQIGVGGATAKRDSTAGYTTVGGSLVPLAKPAVPSQAPVRDLTKGF